jgi:hypothetical protein
MRRGEGGQNEEEMVRMVRGEDGQNEVSCNMMSN